MLPRGIIADGDRSGSMDARGEMPREEGREETDDGRDDIEPWFLTTDACVRRGLTLLGTAPSLGGVCGIELLTGVFDLLRARFEAGESASLCAWNGFRKTVFAFFGADVGLLIGEDPA